MLSADGPFASSLFISCKLARSSERRAPVRLVLCDSDHMYDAVWYRHILITAAPYGDSILAVYDQLFILKWNWFQAEQPPPVSSNSDGMSRLFIPNVNCLQMCNDTILPTSTYLDLEM